MGVRSGFLGVIHLTDEPIYDDQGNPVQDPDNDPREWVKTLRKDAKEGKKAQRELETLKRDLVFSEAGIPSEGVGKLFREAYKGDVTPDAVRAGAQEYGILDAPPNSEPGPEEQHTVQRTAAATAGATAPPPESLDEQLAATEKLPEWQRPAAIRDVMVRNNIWVDTAQYE